MSTIQTALITRHVLKTSAKTLALFMTHADGKQSVRQPTTDQFANVQKVGEEILMTNASNVSLFFKIAIKTF